MDFPNGYNKQTCDDLHMDFPYGYNKQSCDDLLPDQAFIWKHLFNFINSFSLKCAVQLGIFDIIHTHKKPMPLSDLVVALSINKAKSDCLHRLMRLLIHSGFFIETPVAHLLLKDNPFSVAPVFETMLDPIVTEPWQRFSDWFKLDANVSLFESFHGNALWEFTGNEPRFNHSFNEAMASDARLVASFVVTKCKDVFEGVDSLVDVGGGTGTMAKGIAKAFPSMSCVVLDLPHVIEGLEGSNNLSFVAGDMFKSLPPANAILLKWILHDWTDDKCIEILERCKDVLPSKGNVIIIDMVVGKDRNPEEVNTKLFYDMHLMTLLNGKERKENQWAKLFFDAGFTYYKINDILGVRSLLEVYP